MVKILEAVDMNLHLFSENINKLWNSAVNCNHIFSIQAQVELKDKIVTKKKEKTNKKKENKDILLFHGDQSNKKKKLQIEVNLLFKYAELGNFEFHLKPR